MKGRFPEPSPSRIPGPGEYLTDGMSKTLKVAPIYSFTKVKKGLEIGRKDVPGPGNYDPKVSSDYPVHKFSKEKRMSQSTERVPGPGAYTLPSTRESVAISMTARHFGQGMEEKPGPGAYDPLATTRTQYGTMGIAPREGGDPKAKDPGPGQYDARPISAPNARK